MKALTVDFAYAKELERALVSILAKGRVVTITTSFRTVQGELESITADAVTVNRPAWPEAQRFRWTEIHRISVDTPEARLPAVDYEETS